jgi:uncharacterized lipoprotein YajG
MKDLEFLREEKTTYLGIEYVTRLYSGVSRAEAIEFLEGTSIDSMKSSVEVETPQGRFGKDFEGMYNRSGSFKDTGDPNFFTGSAGRMRQS